MILKSIQVIDYCCCEDILPLTGFDFKYLDGLNGRQGFGWHSELYDYTEWLKHLDIFQSRIISHRKEIFNP